MDNIVKTNKMATIDPRACPITEVVLGKFDMGDDASFTVEFIGARVPCSTERLVDNIISGAVGRKIRPCY